MSAAPPSSIEPHGTADRLPTRNEIVRLFGTPTETVGSVNESRLSTEHGVEYNEKWVYDRPLHDPSRPRSRVIYWRRYDFVASARIERSGQWVGESPAEILAREPAGAH